MFSYCSLACNKDDPFYPGGVKCNFYSAGDRSGWDACKDSYVDPNTGECVTNCGPGRYGFA